MNDWRRTGRPVAGPSRSGATVHLRSRITAATIRSVEFLDDHSVLTPRFRPSYDYARGGQIYHAENRPHYLAFRPPETVDGDELDTCYPASLSRGTRTTLFVEVDVGPPGAEIEWAKLAGVPTQGSHLERFPQFHSSEPMLLDPDDNPNVFTVQSDDELPWGPIHFAGLFLTWQLVFDDRTLDAGSSGAHRVLITYGTPSTGTASREEGVTIKRMIAAVNLAYESCMSTWNTFEDLSVRRFMEAFNDRYPRYGFEPVPTMTEEYLNATGAVGYLRWRQNSSLPWIEFGNHVGGAWPHVDFPGEDAECQALVRLADGVLKQLGMPATTQRAYIYAHPSKGSRHTPIYQPWVDMPTQPTDGRPRLSDYHMEWVRFTDPNGQERTVLTWVFCNLITLPHPQEGVLYAIDDLGINQYEAILRVQTTAGELFYYAGGAGIIRIHEDEEDETTPTDEERELQTRTLHAFQALVWWARVRPVGATTDEGLVVRVVARYH